MKTDSTYLTRLARTATALVSAAAIFTSVFAINAGAESSKEVANKLKEDQKILHALNRLGFGARPGDVERVKAMGLDKYIELQLHPEKIDDSAAEAKLQNLETLRMTSAELYEKYPQPGQLLLQLQKRNDLPADLAAARDNRVKGGANTAKTGDAVSGEMQTSTNPNAKPANPAADQN